MIIQTWHIAPTQSQKLALDASTLDEVTRQLPDGYYSTFRTFDGCRRVPGLTAHLQRLYGPVSTPGVDESHLRRQLSALLEPYQPGEARVRVIMTKAGEAYIAIQPLEPLPRAIYERGMYVETIDLQREHPRLKSTTFISQSNPEREHIAKERIFEALLVKDGKILEGMTSNFFYVPRAEHASTAFPHSAQRGGILCTTRENILLGVTRKTVIDIARGMGLAVKYQPLGRDQLETVDEAFITSSSRGIVPVVKIDTVTLGQGSPGPVTRALMDNYESYVLEKAEKI